MEDMDYTTPQDKLLVMLVERISALEDEQTKLRQSVEQSNKNLEHIWVRTASYFYSVELSLKDTRPPFGEDTIQNRATLIQNKLDTIKTLITNAFPRCKLSVNRENEREVYNYREKMLYIQFENRIMIDTLMDMLDIPMLYHAEFKNWNKLSENDMKDILRNNDLVPL